MKRVDAPGGQAAGRDIHNYFGPRSVPPDAGHRHARRCPQCGVVTWALTQHCIRCGLDLAAYDRRERERSRTRRRRVVLVGVVAAVAFAAWGMARGVPAGVAWPSADMVLRWLATALAPPR